MKKTLSIGLIVFAVIALAVVGLIVRGIGPSVRSLTGRTVRPRTASAV
jgi:hypothetical protein